MARKVPFTPELVKISEKKANIAEIRQLLKELAESTKPTEKVFIQTDWAGFCPEHFQIQMTAAELKNAATDFYIKNPKFFCAWNQSRTAFLMSVWAAAWTFNGESPLKSGNAFLSTERFSGGRWRINMNIYSYQRHVLQG